MSSSFAKLQLLEISGNFDCAQFVFLTAIHINVRTSSDTKAELRKSFTFDKDHFWNKTGFSRLKSNKQLSKLYFYKTRKQIGDSKFSTLIAIIMQRKQQFKNKDQKTPNAKESNHDDSAGANFGKSKSNLLPGANPAFRLIDYNPDKPTNMIRLRDEIFNAAKLQFGKIADIFINREFPTYPLPKKPVKKPEATNVPAATAPDEASSKQSKKEKSKSTPAATSSGADGVSGNQNQNVFSNLENAEEGEEVNSVIFGYNTSIKPFGRCNEDDDDMDYESAMITYQEALRFRSKTIEADRLKLEQLFAFMWSNMTLNSRNRVRIEHDFEEAQRLQCPLRLWIIIVRTHTIQCSDTNVQSEEVRAAVRDEWNNCRMYAHESLVEFRQRVEDILEKFELVGEVQPSGADMAFEYLRKLHAPRYAQLRADIHNGYIIHKTPPPQSLDEAHELAANFNVVTHQHRVASASTYFTQTPNKSSKGEKKSNNNKDGGNNGNNNKHAGGERKGGDSKKKD